MHSFVGDNQMNEVSGIVPAIAYEVWLQPEFNDVPVDLEVGSDGSVCLLVADKALYCSDEEDGGYTLTQHTYVDGEGWAPEEATVIDGAETVDKHNVQETIACWINDSVVL